MNMISRICRVSKKKKTLQCFYQGRKNDYFLTEKRNGQHLKQLSIHYYSEIVKCVIIGK